MMLVMFWPCWAVCIQTAKSSCPGFHHSGDALRAFTTSPFKLPRARAQAPIMLVMCSDPCPNIWPKPSQPAQMMLVMLWPYCCFHSNCKSSRAGSHHAGDVLRPVQIFGQSLQPAQMMLVMLWPYWAVFIQTAKSSRAGSHHAGDVLRPVQYLAKALTTSPNDAGDALSLLA